MNGVYGANTTSVLEATIGRLRSEKLAAGLLCHFLRMYPPGHLVSILNDFHTKILTESCSSPKTQRNPNKFKQKDHCEEAPFDTVELLLIFFPWNHVESHSLCFTSHLQGLL